MSTLALPSPLSSLLFLAFLSPALIAQEESAAAEIEQEDPEATTEPEKKPSYTSLNLGFSGYGISFGNSRRWSGLRLNFRDIGVEEVRGINLTFGAVHAQTENKRVEGLALGIAPMANEQRGIALGLLATVAHDSTGWLQLGGLANVSEGDMQGISIGGLANVAERDVRGVQIGGLAVVAGDDLCGVQVAGLASVAEGNQYGISVGGLAVVAEKNFQGLGFGGLAMVTEGSFRGLAIGGLAVAAEKDFEGVGIAGLAIAAGGEDAKAWSWAPAEGYASSARGVMVAGYRVGAHKLQGLFAAGFSVRAHELEGLGVSAYNVVTGTQNGLTVGVFNHAAHLKGVQIGLLNHVASNPWPFRWLPVMNVPL